MNIFLLIHFRMDKRTASDQNLSQIIQNIIRRHGKNRSALFIHPDPHMNHIRIQVNTKHTVRHHRKF